MRGQRSSSMTASGLGGERQGQDHEVGDGEQLGQASMAAEDLDARPDRLASARAAADGHDPGAERPRQARPPAQPIAAQTDQPDRGVAQLRGLRAAATSARAAARSAAGSRRQIARIIVITYSAIGWSKTPRPLVTSVRAAERTASGRARRPTDAEWIQRSLGRPCPAAGREDRRRADQPRSRTSTSSSGSSAMPSASTGTSRAPGAARGSARRMESEGVAAGRAPG